MRTLKFRAWDKHLKKFHKLKLGEGYWSCDGRAVFSVECKPGDYATCETAFEKNFVFQQCTGLKDSDKKEIYEGDIVKRLNTEYIYKIRYDEENAVYLVENKDGEYPLSYYRKVVQVIGNIFENPELLK